MNTIRKVVRLPSGRFITRKLAESTPERLAAAKPEEIWTTADDRCLVIEDMETRHLVNVIKSLESRARAVKESLNLSADVSALAASLDSHYIPMRAELARRTQPEKPESIQETTSRKFTA